jgi:hypothetical protein
MEPVALGSLTGLSRQRIVSWGALVGAMSALAYGSNAAGSGEPERDLLFRWSTAIGSLVLYAIVLALTLAIASSVRSSVIGLVRPRAWGVALGLALAGLVAVGLINGIFQAAGLDAGREQGLVPDAWDASRAAPFVANFVVVAGVAPVVEELLFRGLGFAAVRQLAGTAWAIAVTGLAFGLSHGLVEALPILALFGAVLAWLRARTGSVYPPIVLHAVFNAAALIAGVSGVGS